LPSFPGAHAVRDALAAGARETGVTIHIVDEGVDTGPVLAQQTVTILPADDEQSLHERIKLIEHKMLVGTVRDLAIKQLEPSKVG
jgi:phosphoribosylglycinamide formyltransferase-1